MATIAKGMITLVNVNDAYSVTVTPSACAIKADFDGTNPVLNEAYCDISVVRGDVKVPFTINSSQASNNGITYAFSGTQYVRRMSLTAIPSNVLSGNVTMNIETDDEFVATAIFQYSVTREATMLDWIQDWESNKTTIGNTYLITPKIFVGKRENVTQENPLGQLTGVYIGPDTTNGAGIYGYKQGTDVFHINENEAVLAGWKINEDSLVSNDNRLRIFSSGAIICTPVGEIDPYWFISSNGEASFAGGNVVLHANGNASFTGTIVSAAGQIGGWHIGQNVIESQYGNVILDSQNLALTIWPTATYGFNSLGNVGGVRMYYTSSVDHGIVAYLPISEGVTRKTFQIGTTNYIAGWSFDETSIYLGTKVNAVHNYTSASGSITIGTNGMRGYGWYIDSNGDASFANGKIVLTNNTAELVGWQLKENRIANSNMALVSYSGVTGLYMTQNTNAQFDTRGATALEDYIDRWGGIYLKIKDAVGLTPASADFAAYDNDGYRLFKIKSGGVSSIANWHFDRNALYSGDIDDLVNVSGEGSFTESGNITLSPVGLRGYKWRFENDGSGGIAGDNIKWDANGNVTFAPSVSLAWSSLSDEAQFQARIAQRMVYGKMLYRDPEFAKSPSAFNGTGEYHNNAAEGANTRTIVNDTAAPTTSLKVMSMVCTQYNTATDHRIGGFCFANQSRANAEFVVRIIANIPNGWKIENYHNEYGNGNGATTKWLTSQDGTDTYTEYICYVKCGSNGTFSTINHFALIPIGSAANTTTINQDDNAYLSVEWRVAYCTVYDITSSDNLTTYIDSNGIYTGTLVASQIVSGTIDTSLINADELLSNGNAWALLQNGSGYLANGNITWNADGTSVVFTGEVHARSGDIGGFSIANGHIGASTTSSGESFGNLSIYNDFFKVGGTKGYVMFGNDVIPGTAGGAFTAVGRIVNAAPNTYGTYGFDQANYGLFINVTGGTKNYGIHSNAALMAPAFITTKCYNLTFTGGSYSVDFSQYNIINMYYNESGYSGTTVTLPTEASVASKFGLSSLPNDFATVVIFRTRAGSLPITLTNVYNQNETPANIVLASGDSAMILITKVDGFRYQLLNYTS